jgi:Protein of unknown function (DUF4007)
MTSITPSFGRHETFHPRVGWLSKAVHAVEDDPEVFLRDSASVDLGVGKNMVRAIRYWATATKVVVERGGRGGGMMASPLGRHLLGQRGVDPYAEDPTTLWLLHWSLLQEPVTAPTWWWLFNEVDFVDFDQPQLARAETDWIISRGWVMPAGTSIERDLDCLVHMYGGRSDRGEAIDSPFRSLGLLERAIGGARRWRFSGGPRPSLDPRVVLYAALVYMAQAAPEAQTMGVARLATARGGPGRTFRLTDSAISIALRGLASEIEAISLAAPGGLTQLQVKGDKQVLAQQVFADCYGRTQPDAQAVEQVLQGLVVRHDGQRFEHRP